jgi:transglutaminase-like putative cysteine protease
MPRRLLIAGCLLVCLAPWAASAATSDSAAQGGDAHARQILSLRQVFLSSNDPAQRMRILRKLRAATRWSSEAVTLQSAVSAMLPDAGSAAEAEQLLSIAVAAPAPACKSSGYSTEDRPYLLAPRRLAQQDVPGKDDAEELADIRIDHLQSVNADGSLLSESHIQQIWRINTAAGAKAFSTRILMYAAMSEKLCLLHARVLRLKGRETKALVSADRPVEERASAMYFDSRTRELRFPHLAAGDLVEIEYRLLPVQSVNPWAGYYARMESFRDGFPTRLRRRVLISPASLPVYAVEHDIVPAEMHTRKDETTRIWEMHDLPALASEALSPGASSLGPYLHLSTIGSLEEFGVWYRTLLEPALELDPKLRERAEKIRHENPTIEGRVEAVYQSVQRDTRYMAFEFGVHSYQPYPLATIERRGFGDCKDKAALMVALLRGAGVEAEFAMVRTRSAGKVASGAYSVQLFNHALAYVPALNLYLDGTVEFAAPGELPPDDQGALAITVNADGKLTRRTIPFAAPEANRISRRIEARLSASGMLHFVSQLNYTGYYAAVERRRSREGELAGRTQAALARFYPSVRIEKAVAEGTSRDSKGVDLRLEGDLDAAGAPLYLEAGEGGPAPAGAEEPLESAGSAAKGEDEPAQIPDKQGLRAEAVPFSANPGAKPPEVASVARISSQREADLHSSLRASRLTTLYATQIERRNPLLIPAVPNEQEQFEYQLPAGAEPLLPPNTLLQSPFGHVEVSYWLDGSTLRVETYTELRPVTVEPADYPAFRTFCRAADQALRREVRVLLP